MTLWAGSTAAGRTLRCPMAFRFPSLLVAPSAPAVSAKLNAVMVLIAPLREERHRALLFSDS